MRAKGAHIDSDHGTPMIAVRIVAALGVEMKKVLNMQSANMMCDSNQARRRVSHGI